MPRTIKAGTTYPPARMLLQDEDGPIDLTNVDTVDYRAVGQGDAGITVTGTFIPDADQSTAPGTPGPVTIEEWPTGRGWVEHALTETAGETDAAAEYHVAAGLHWSHDIGDPDLVEWIPSEGAEVLTIEEV